MNLIVPLQRFRRALPPFLPHIRRCRRRCGRQGRVFADSTKSFVICGRSSEESNSFCASAKTSPTVPKRKILPFLSTRIESAYLAMSSMLCEMISIVLWRCFWYSISPPRISSRPRGSAPQPVRRARAPPVPLPERRRSAARRFCPPDSSNGERDSTVSSMPQKAAARATRASHSSADRFIFFGPKAMSARTVSSKS